MPRPDSVPSTVVPGNSPDSPGSAQPPLLPVSAGGTLDLRAYVLLDQLGQGGMGQVFRSRDPGLGRELAVKVLRPRWQGNARMEAYFEQEARITGMLQHPNIVPVYNLGRLPDGRLYFTMKVVRGCTFAQLLKQPEETQSSHLAIFEKVCQTLAYAHSKHVIHRDLKPLNVMVGAFGEVQVMDWGVAKVLPREKAGPGTEVAGASAFQALRNEHTLLQTTPDDVKGTYAYMSPEQARGAIEQVDKRADVFGLGAMLCEILTGKPPYMGQTSADIQGQARRAELGPALERLDRCGADGELVALTKQCLSVKPSARPADAGEVTQTVNNYLSQVQQRLLEADRKRAAAEAREAEAVLGARAKRNARRMTIGLGAVLLAGSIVAAMLTIQANQARALADQSAEAERITRKNLEKTNDDLQSSMARRLVRPLGLQIQPNQNQFLPPLSDTEVAALRELGETGEEKIRRRFVEEALRNPVTTRQLRYRAGYALQAAVGLDVQRREEVVGLLVQRLERKELTPEEINDLALCLVALGCYGPREAATLTHLMSRTTNAYTLQTLAKALAEAGGLEPKEAAATCGKAAVLLAQNLTKWKDANELQQLGEGLEAVASRLEPKEAKTVATTLQQVLTESRDPMSILPLAHALGTMARHLELKDAAKICSQAAAPLNLAFTWTPETQWNLLARSLAAIAEFLEPKDARKAAATINLAMTKATGHSVLNEMALALPVVAQNLEPREADATCSQAAAIVTRTISKLDNQSVLYPLAYTLAAARLEPKDAREAAAILNLTINKTTDPYALIALEQALVAVAGRLDPKDVRAAAASLNQALPKTKSPLALVHGLAAMAARMEPEEADATYREAATTLSLTITRPQDPLSLSRLGQALAAVSARLQPKDAKEVAAALNKVLTKETNVSVFQVLAHPMAMVIARLDPNDAREMALLIDRTLTDPMKTNVSWPLAEVLVAAVEQMEPREAVATLTQALNKTPPFAWRVLIRDLIARATRLEPREGASTLALVMRKIVDPTVWPEFAQSLKKVAAGLKPQEAEAAYRQVASTLLQGIKRAMDWYTLLPLTKALAVVAGGMESREAAATCNQAADKLTLVLNQTKDPLAMPALVEGLAALAPYLEAKEAAQATAASNQALTTITQALTKTSDPRMVMGLSQALEAVAAHLEPKEGAATLGQSAATLGQTIAQAPNPLVLHYLSTGLAAILLRETTDQRSQRISAVASSIGLTASPASLSLPFPGISRAMKPFPEPVPTEKLVDLLKHPMCLGVSRRIVLNVLGIRYQRTFADQWDFVRFATENKLGLDLTSPAKRSTTVNSKPSENSRQGAL